ncbi:MAG: hypothetical protein ACYS47_07830 [Planctomycetota bacterium]
MFLSVGRTAVAEETAPSAPAPKEEEGKKEEAEPPAEEAPAKPVEGEAGPAPPAEEKPAEGVKPQEGEKPKEGEKPAEEGKKAGEKSPEEAREITELTAKELRRETQARLFLRSPFQGGRNSFFHSLVYVPPVRGAYGLAPEQGAVSLAFEMSGSDGGREGGNRFEATHFEGLLNLSFTLTEMVEFHGSLCTALLSGDVDLTWEGTSMVEADRDERLRISRLVLGTKFNLLPLGRGAPDIWLALDFKVQGTDKDLADSGRPGVAFSLLATQPLGPVWAHLNIGWSVSDGQKSFPPVVNLATGQPESIRTDRIFFWGLSFVWPLTKSFAVTLQGMGHTNGFKELSVLSSDVHVVSAGARMIHRMVFGELALGGGVTESSLDWFARLEVGMLF